MKRTATVLCSLSLVALLAVGCKNEAPAPVEEATTAVEEVEAPTEPAAEAQTEDPMAFEPAAKGGTLVVGQIQEPETLYSLGGSMLAASHVLNAIYDGPIEGMSYDYQPVILESLPKLENSGATMEPVSVEAGAQYVDAEKQEVVTATAKVDNLPQLTVTFKMKPGIKWQDGTPVTAADSVFAQKLSCDPDTPTSKYTCERTAKYEATDDVTIVWQGLPGFTDQTYFTNFYSPLPRHQTNEAGAKMEEVPAAEVLEDETFTRKPLSFGPFQIEEWVTGESIKLKRNENYWRASEGLPFLDEVIFKIIPDSASLVAALKSGDVDVGTQTGLDLDQYDALTEAETAGEIVNHFVVGTAWEHIDFNHQPLDDSPAFGACKEFRHAVAYGTDRQAMVDAIQKGKTKVQDTVIPDTHWAFPPAGTLTTYSFDPEKAKGLLDGLGFADDDNNPDTPRVASKDITCTVTTGLDGATADKVIKQGTKLELTLNTTKGNKMREDSTLLFQAFMKDIGVGINLEYQEAAVLFGDGPDGTLYGRKFDLGQFAWLTGVQPPTSLYWCSEIPSEENAWAGQNETGWCNPAYDQVAKEADNTLARAEALPKYHEAQKMFTDDLPVMPLFARVKVMATAPDVVNFKPNPTVNSETWNIETWGYKEARPTQ